MITRERLNAMPKNSVAFSVLALLAALVEIGKTPQEIHDGLDTVRNMLDEQPRIAVPVFPLDASCRALISEVEADERA